MADAELLGGSGSGARNRENIPAGNWPKNCLLIQPGQAKIGGAVKGRAGRGAIRPVTTTLAGCYPVATETPDTIASLMATMAGYGAAGIKVTSSGDFARDTERLRTCRAALGTGTPLIVCTISLAWVFFTM